MHVPRESLVKASFWSLYYHFILCSAIDSLLLVRTELVTLTCWFDLGLALLLLPHTLTAIRTSNRDDIHQCVTDVVAAWLERQDNVSKPSWRSLVEALLSPSINCQVLARRITETYSTSQSKIVMLSCSVMNTSITAFLQVNIL